MSDEFRVSPSQINRFLNEPALWILGKFYRVYGDSGPAAFTGTAVEKGLESILVHGHSHDMGLEWAQKVFDEEANRIALTKELQEEAAIERARIPALLQQAEDQILQFDGFQGFQIPVEGRIDGVLVVGKKDFAFPDFDLDLKTTKKMPSCVENISPEHLRQLWVYRELSNREQKISYVTEKKGCVYVPTEEQYAVTEREVRGAIRAMRTAYMLDTDIVKALFPPRSYGNYLWDDKTRAAAYKEWRYPKIEGFVGEPRNGLTQQFQP